MQRGKNSTAWALKIPEINLDLSDMPVAAYSASSTSLEYRLVQAASGCVPSVEDLAIFDVKQAECGTPLGWVTVQSSE